MVSQKKQVKRLKKDAQRLWVDQQALLGRANTVARDAYPHAQSYAKDRIDAVAPGARTLYADRVVPAAQVGAKLGKAAGSYVGSTARDAAQGVIVPAVSSALTAALGIANEAGERIGLGDSRSGGQGTAKRLGKVTASGYRSEAKARTKLKAAGAAGRLAAKQGSKQVAKAAGRDSGLGFRGIAGILLGAGVVAGIGYAVWQTLRADDDLWVADEDPETTATTDAPTA